MGRRVVLMLVAAVACGEPEVDSPPAMLAEVCGEEAPVRLIGVAENEELGKTVVRDDVVLAVIDEYDGVLPDGIPSLQTRVGGRVVSVDACGRDERVVFGDVDRIHEPTDEAAPWLARTEAGELYWIDPRGRFESRRVGHASWFTEHEGHAYVTVPGDNAGLLDLARLVIEGDAATLETVAVDLRVAVGSRGARPGSALVIDAEDRLLEVELVTGVSTLVLEGVAEFNAAQEGRFVLWRAARDDESTSLFQPWFVLDRETGTVVQVSDNEEAQIAGQAIMRSEPGPDPVAYVWLLPGLQAHLLAGAWAWFSPTPDGRVIATRSGLTELWIFDAPDLAPRPLYSGDFSQVRVMDDSVWVSLNDSQLQLVQVPLDGSPVRSLATGLYNPLWFGGNVFAGVDVRDSNLPLMVLRDGERGKVDEGVSIYPFVGSTDDAESGAREFFYEVFVGPGRKGLYRVTIPP